MTHPDKQFDVINEILLTDSNYLTYSNLTENKLLDKFKNIFTKKKKLFKDDIKIILSKNAPNMNMFKSLNEHLNYEYIITDKRNNTNTIQIGGVKAGHEDAIILQDGKLYKKENRQLMRVYIDNNGNGNLEESYKEYDPELVFYKKLLFIINMPNMKNENNTHNGNINNSTRTGSIPLNNTVTNSYNFLKDFYNITTCPLLPMVNNEVNINTVNINDNIYYPIGNLKHYPIGNLKPDNDWQEIIDYKIGLYTKNNYDYDLKKEKHKEVLHTTVYNQLHLDTISTSYQNGFRLEGCDTSLFVGYTLHFNGIHESTNYIYDKGMTEANLSYLESKLDPLYLNTSIIDKDITILYDKIEYNNIDKDIQLPLLHLLHNNPFLTDNNSILLFLLFKYIEHKYLQSTDYVKKIAQKTKKQIIVINDLVKEYIKNKLSSLKKSPSGGGAKDNTNYIPKKQNRPLYSIPVILSIDRIIIEINKVGALDAYKKELYNIYKCFINTHKFTDLETNPICGFIGASIMITYKENDARIRLSDFGHPYFIYEQDKNKQVIEKQIFINFVLGLYKFICYNVFVINITNATDLVSNLDCGNDNTIELRSLLLGIDDILTAYPNIYPEYSNTILTNNAIIDKFSYIDKTGNKQGIDFNFSVESSSSSEKFGTLTIPNLLKMTYTTEDIPDDIQHTKKKNAINRLIYLQKQNILLHKT